MKAVALGVLLTACSGSDHVDLSGVYQVSVDVASMPCGMDQPVVMPPAYLHFVKMDLLGQSYFTYENCSDAAATMCDGAGDLFSAFTEPTSNGWKGELTAWSPGGGTCALTYNLRTATLMKGALVVEIEDHTGTEMIPDTQCTDAEAKKSGPSLPCEMHEHIEAMKL
jgi:hypothetical protein